MPDSTERNARWIERWDEGSTPWHREDVHPTLIANFRDTWRRVFVPLCGATVDIDWLAEQGVEVAGADLSGRAAEAVFERLKVEPTRERVGPFEVWSAGSVTIFVGDLFEADPEVLGTFDAVWDRAALVAIAPQDRGAYVTAVTRVAPGAELLLEVIDYAEHVMEGPPYAVPDDYVRATFEAVEPIDEAPMQQDFLDDDEEGFFVRRAYRATL